MKLTGTVGRAEGAVDEVTNPELLQLESLHAHGSNLSQGVVGDHARLSTVWAASKGLVRGRGHYIRGRDGVSKEHGVSGLRQGGG